MHVSSNAHNLVDSSRHIRSYEHMILLSLGPVFGRGFIFVLFLFVEKNKMAMAHSLEK